MDKENKECFIIMPISDCDGYPENHFLRVYEDIIKPSVITAGFFPVRADEVSMSNIIQIDILRHLVNAPMSICDLSSRNPNVLFELGVRQSFDKPVTLIQDKETPQIFDISPLRYYKYSKEMSYRDVRDAIPTLTKMIRDTYEKQNKEGNINSIVKLLALDTPAQIPQITDSNDSKLNLILSQLKELKNDILIMQNKGSKNKPNVRNRYFDIKRNLDNIRKSYSLDLVSAKVYIDTLFMAKNELTSLYYDDNIELDNYTYNNFTNLINDEIAKVSQSVQNN